MLPLAGPFSDEECSCESEAGPQHGSGESEVDGGIATPFPFPRFVPHSAVCGSAGSTRGPVHMQLEA